MCTYRKLNQFWKFSLLKYLSKNYKPNFGTFRAYIKIYLFLKLVHFHENDLLKPHSKGFLINNILINRDLLFIDISTSNCNVRPPYKFYQSNSHISKWCPLSTIHLIHLHLYHNHMSTYKFPKSTGLGIKVEWNSHLHLLK